MYGFQHRKNSSLKPSTGQSSSSSKKLFKKNRSNSDKNCFSSNEGPRRYECNGYGHFAKNCSNRSDKKQFTENVNNDNKKHGMFTDLFVQTSADDSDWILDSGCSTHLT
ncbi:hypothetical protein JTB14_016198 [Gonioctena quinquepunctata]|nr:hypothetical protein JTB14_016198 [Gonioctena quinquepunctata]